MQYRVGRLIGKYSKAGSILTVLKAINSGFHWKTWYNYGMVIATMLKKKTIPPGQCRSFINNPAGIRFPKVFVFK